MTDTLHWSDERAEVHKVVVGQMGNNVYILRCRETGEAVLIDAANEPERLLRLCEELGVRQVLQTHGHWDHIQAVPALREAGYQVGVAEGDAGQLAGHDFTIEPDQELAVGRLRLRALATPGHTPGSVCFTLVDGPVLFSGDTLFPGGPGNTSFPGSDFEAVIESIRDQLFALHPDETMVLPGHGDGTTIGAERPQLQEWIDRGW